MKLKPDEDGTIRQVFETQAGSSTSPHAKEVTIVGVGPQAYLWIGNESGMMGSIEGSELHRLMRGLLAATRPNMKLVPRKGAHRG